MTAAQIYALLPILIMASTSVVVMLCVAFFPQHLLVNRVTALGFLATFLSIFYTGDVQQGIQITPLIIIDHYGLFYSGLVILASLVITLLSFSYFSKNKDATNTIESGEYYILLTTATLGAMVLVSSNHFASLFIGIELLGVSLYVLVAYLAHHRHGREASLEAGIKYLVLSGVASALLLFGIALTYAEFGVLEFGQLGEVWSNAAAVNSIYAMAGLGLVLAGICFKLSLIPFHMWTPDVYEGAPVPATAYIATISKGAIFAVLLRFFVSSGAFQQEMANTALMVIAIASMLGGNLLALLQSNVTRILAYSSIAHIGYLLVVFLVGNTGSVSVSLISEAVGFYLVAYIVTTLGAFGVMTVRSNMLEGRDADLVEDYKGLFWHSPWLAAVMTAMLLSLAGIPLTVGFIGKFYIFTVGVEGFKWLLVSALVIGSAIGLYYYVRIIIVMFMRHDEEHVSGERDAHVTVMDSLVLAGLAGVLLWMGIYPEPMIEIIQAAGLG